MSTHILLLQSDTGNADHCMGRIANNIMSLRCNLKRVEVKLETNLVVHNLARFIVGQCFSTKSDVVYKKKFSFENDQNIPVNWYFSCET